MIAVLGPTISSTSGAVAPLADQNQMPTIAPAATADSVETGGYLFRTCFKDSYQGEIAAKYAAETLKVKKVAVLYGTGDPYSSGVGKAFVAAAKKNGLDVVAEENSSSADDLVRNSYMRRTTIPRLARTLCHRRERSAMRATSWAPTATTASKPRETKRTTTRCCTPRIIRRMTSPTRRCSSSSPHTRRPITANRRTPSPRKRAIEQAGENATRADIRNAIAGMSFSGVTGAFTLDKHGSPKKSVIVLEMSDGEPTYKDTIQPAK